MTAIPVPPITNESIEMDEPPNYVVMELIDADDVDTTQMNDGDALIDDDESSMPLNTGKE